MANAKTYKELQIPKGAAKSFVDALTMQNDGNAPARKKKTTTSKKSADKKSK